jgi:coproporphyrinogen III oxidase
MTKKEISGWFRILQEDISKNLEHLDGKGKFRQDMWQRKGGGGGRTRILEEGNLIEKGGVNFSEVFGNTTREMKEKLGLPGTDFYATGISIVLHPVNPMIPIIHMNTRYFETGYGKKWFGGGIDLTPHYINRKDASFFHGYLKNICDQYEPEYYSNFKKEADEYFYLHHRKESRGIGGIFYDYLTDPNEERMEKIFAFTRAVGSSFLPVYRELVNRNRNKPFGAAEKRWQEIRRGRYVEFNLVWDKGTKFGLETAGRTESILMSLPASAQWVYDYHPVKNSKEWETLRLLRKGIDWINTNRT